jgi:hypothetical protein
VAGTWIFYRVRISWWADYFAGGYDRAFEPTVTQGTVTSQFFIIAATRISAWGVQPL